MILAYTNFEHLTIIWATLSVLGLLAAVWSLRQSFLDRRQSGASASPSSTGEPYAGRRTMTR